MRTNSINTYIIINKVTIVKISKNEFQKSLIIYRGWKLFKKYNFIFLFIAMILVYFNVQKGVILIQGTTELTGTHAGIKQLNKQTTLTVACWALWFPKLYKGGL